MVPRQPEHGVLLKSASEHRLRNETRRLPTNAEDVTVPRENRVTKTGTLHVLRGLPASGKTTLAKHMVEDAVSGNEMIRVNRDDLRMQLFGEYVFWVEKNKKEHVVTTVQHAMITAALMSGINVVSDDTNLNAKFLRDLKRKVADPIGAKFLLDDRCLSVDVEECKRRDLTRVVKGERSVGHDVINSFFTRYVANRKNLPTQADLDEVRDLPAQIYVADTSKPRAWLVDIDGTLALMNGRSPYDYARVKEDNINAPVCDIVEAIGHDDLIVLMSGRPESCRDDTEDWLKQHDIWFDHLFMRPTEDKRKDAIVKLELFDTYVRPHFYVKGVFDDRSQVVRVWRDTLGLTCLQVADGQF